MPIPSWFSSPLAAIGLALVLTGTAPAADKPDPPGTTLYMTQLRGIFGTWDRNNDKHLDRQELARGFRGAKAKPYAPPAQPTKGSKEPDLSRYPDALFLVQLDKDGDDKISRKEFEEWARAYAKQIHDMVAAEERILNLQKKMIRAAKSELAKMEAQMKNERAAMEKMANQMQAFEKHFQQQLKSGN